uniref:Zinc finger CCCH-type containing 7B n=1 Tax=Neogobius melanostomus TaxID=47308 RepID=A0A8C6WKD6_9GOBI
MDPGRLKRREEICKEYLTGLVCNLLQEGNALFKDASWEEAVKEFSEGLDVSQYAASEDIHIPEVLLESLLVNRAAAYYSMGEYERGVEDCDKVLSLCKESHRGLYRKALCLKELGKYKEAYSCTTDCLLINRMDNQVNELAQDLAIHLGLKIRKPYVSAKVSHYGFVCTILDFFPCREGIYTFVHKPGLVHSCGKNILLCREKDSVIPWTRVRQRPPASFFGPFILCREIQQSGDLGLCKFGEDCTFAFNQLEIDVWTEERKGTFDRDLLFDKPALNQDPAKAIVQILEENKGMFIFLCGACFDGKPTIISQRSRDDSSICSNVNVRHLFEANKCFAFMMRNINVRYKRIRRLHVRCQLDLCRHSIRYGCLLGDKCMFAHSEVELKTWKLQRETGTTPDEMVKVSTNYYDKLSKNLSNKQQNDIKVSHFIFMVICLLLLSSLSYIIHLLQSLGTIKPRGGRPKEHLKMRMRFVCGHCWRDGVTSDPDKALKYCSAKAKHMWTKDKRILLVKSLERSKWVMVRTLPHCKHFPLHYDVLVCNVGNCTFAHSQEEKDMWTYMKNTKLVDMQQVYDMWLTLSTLNHQKDERAVSQSPPQEKCIVMPTDYAEPMVGTLL